MVWNIKYKETFTKKGTNTAAIGPGETLALQFYDEAIRDNNIPHNTFTISNLSGSVTVFIFLDDYSNVDTPDYTLFPNQSITLSAEEGQSFTTLWIRNTHGADDINTNELKYRISTVKENANI